MEKEIRKDYRRHTPKGNLKDRYVNVKQWKESKLARDIEETVELLPVSGEEINVGTLREGLKKYGYDDEYSLKVIRETAEDDKRVRARS